MCDTPAAPSVAPVRCLPLRVRFKRLPEGLSDDDDPGSEDPSGDEYMNVTAEHAAELALKVWQGAQQAADAAVQQPAQKAVQQPAQNAVQPAQDAVQQTTQALVLRNNRDTQVTESEI